MAVAPDTVLVVDTQASTLTVSAVNEGSLLIEPVTQTFVFHDIATTQISVQGVGPQGPVGPAGATGATGPQGIQGIPGVDGGSAFYFAYIQSSPASSWNVVHNLGRYPNVSFIDVSGNVCLSDIEHVDINTVHLTFPSPVTGTAICS